MKNIKIVFTYKEVKAIREGLINPEDLFNIVKRKIEVKEAILEKNSVLSKERKERISKARRIKNRELELYKIAEEFKTDLIIHQTDSEKIFKAILKSLDIRYEFQKIVYTTTRFYIVDFYIPDKQIVFEIDGSYHEGPIQKKRDSYRTSNLKTLGVKELYRFTDDDILKNQLYVTDRIKSLL